MVAYRPLGGFLRSVEINFILFDPIRGSFLAYQMKGDDVARFEVTGRDGSFIVVLFVSWLEICSRDDV